METELLKIFDDEGKEIGQAPRSEVHMKGHWHKAFHCWFISREEGREYIFFQKRSAEKKDYANLYDITAAGHLLAHETVMDGVREIQEELGIEVSMDELVSLGLLKYSVIREDLEFIDKELAHVFLYKSTKTMDDFKLQKEEVSGIVKADFASFYKLWLGDKDSIHVEGFEMDYDGERVTVNQMLRKDEFVPHDSSFYRCVCELIRKNV